MTNTPENPIGFVEIPVADLDRAERFYHAVFGFDFVRQFLDGNQMSFFPFDPARPGITGSLAQGEIYVPSRHGAVVYFNTTSIDVTLAQATAAGAEILYPRTTLPGLGFVAEFADSEGNRIALFEPEATPPLDPPSA